MSTAYDLSLEDLTTMVTGWGEPAYRAKQVWRQLWQRAATYDEMTDLPPALRERLAEELPLGVEVLDERTSDRGATRKSLLRLGGEHVIETVLMGYPRPRHGLHLLAVGVRDGLHVLRDRTDGPAQQPDGRRDRGAGRMGAPRSGAPAPTTPQRLANVVFMGMGEPLANERHVFAAIERLTDRATFGMGARHVTVSTVGLVPGITHLTAAHPQVGLAVSFHAASDELRSSLVPPNDLYPLAVLEEAMAAWRAATHRRPSIEWAMIDRVNDTEEQATLLAPIARRLGAHVNLIPLNPTPGYAVVGSSKGRIRRFVDALERARVNVTVRDTRGRTIDAACGQLAISASASPRPRPAATSRSS